MIFKIIRSSKSFIIECTNKTSETSKTSEVYGYRGEGNNPKITLLCNKIKFNYVPKSIHPDIIALICVIIFYPFFKPGGRVSFPEKISFKLAKELEILPIYEMVTLDADSTAKYQKAKLGIKINNDDINPTLVSYKGKGGSVLSFGGGLDSLAVLSLFPKITLVHETCSKYADPDILKETGIFKLLETIASKNAFRKKHYIISTNSKELTDPPGWTTWISCIATSLLLANDLGITNIVLGSSMGSLLGSCAKFRKNGYEFPMNSIWSNLFEKAANIKLVTPILGLSELSLIKLIDKDLLQHAIWCEKSTDRVGYPCLSCAKCFRRILLLMSSDVFGVPDWSNFNNPGVHRLLRLLLSNKSSYKITYGKVINFCNREIGPTLYYLLKKHKDNLPHWISRYLLMSEPLNDSVLNTNLDLKDTNLDLKNTNLEGSLDLFAWYHRSLAYLPVSLRSYVYEKIATKVRPMTSEEMDLFEEMYGSST